MEGLCLGGTRSASRSAAEASWIKVYLMPFHPVWKRNDHFFLSFVLFSYINSYVHRNKPQVALSNQLESNRTQKPRAAIARVSATITKP